MINTGKAFEKLAEEIFIHLSQSGNIGDISHNIFLDGPDGKRQIDILIKSNSPLGFNILTVIECKDYNSKISVTKIDEFHSKLIDVKANKGVLISRKGFSSTAISKARRLGITLCTAHEALQPKWDIDIDLPVFIEEVFPINIEPRFAILLNKGDIIDTKNFIINGFDIFKLFEKKWHEKNIIIEDEIGACFFEPEIKHPYKFQIKRNDKIIFIDIENFSMNIKFRKKYYRSYLNKLSGTKLLKNITENTTNILIDIKELNKYKIYMEEISRNIFNSSEGLNVVVQVKPILGNLAHAELSIKELGSYIN